METYGINRITPSGLNLYDSCPRAFYYAVYLGLKLPQSMVHLDFGTAIHLAIDHIYEGRVDGKWTGRTAGDGAIAIFMKSFRPDSCKDLTKTQGGVTRDLTPEEKKEKYEEMLADGIQIIKEYWDNKEILLAKGVDPLQFEIPGKDHLLNPESKEPLPLPLSYRLDGIGKNNTVIEFKTSSEPYCPFETRVKAQSLCYAWVYYQKYGVVPVVHYVVMIKKRKKDKIQHLPIPYDVADLMAFDARVRATLEKIKNKEFNKPRVGHPRFCDCTKFEKELNIT